MTWEPYIIAPVIAIAAIAFLRVSWVLWRKKRD